MLVSEALDGAVLYWRVQKNLSERTIEGYIYKMSFLIRYVDDCDIQDIDSSTMQDYMIWLRQYQKDDGKPLAKRTILQHWTALCSFFRFASECLDCDFVMEGIPPPKAPTTSDVDPFTKSEVERILKAIKPRRGSLISLRNRAIVMVLLDVGLRNMELRNLRICDYRSEDGRLHVIGGKGDKDRFVYIGKKTQFAIWQYLAERKEDDPDAWLFARLTGNQLDRQELNKDVTKKIGKRAGVANCNPHRFRHTCAVLRIIHGESAEMLMHVLGHTTIKQVMYYVKIAKMDTRHVQRRVSPMDNL